ncbi:MAG: hypothetical protein FJ280_06665 [Planctomycetes bacterium]|nr:hypothetical protein [Planctomycetota bacterium]
MIRFQCRHCGHPLNAPGTAANRKGKCPKCHGIVRIPIPAHGFVGDRATAGPTPEASAIKLPRLAAVGLKGGDWLRPARNDQGRRIPA